MQLHYNLCDMTSLPVNGVASVALAIPGYMLLLNASTINLAGSIHTQMNAAEAIDDT